MEIVKKTILLEDFIDRSYNSPVWGVMPKNKSIYLNIMLTQTMDNMGIFADIEYSAKTESSSIPDYKILKDKLFNLNITNFNFYTNIFP